MIATPSDSRVRDLFDRAFALHQSERLDEAQSLYHEVLALDPGHAHALHSLGAIAYSRGQHRSAIELFQRAIRLRGDEVVFYHSLAQSLRADGNSKEAVKILQKALSINPEFAPGWQALAAVQYALNETSAAARTLQTAATLQIKAAEAHNQRGIELATANRLPESIAEFRAGIACNPNASGLYYNLGKVLSSVGQSEDAIACLTHASKLEPNSAYIHAGLSNALLARGDSAGAMAAWDRAQTLDPNLRGAPSIAGSPSGESRDLNIAVAQHRGGNLALAESLYRKVLAADAKNVRALRMLGFLLVQTGHAEVATGLIQKSLSLDAAQPDLAASALGLSNAAATLCDFASTLSVIGRDTDSLVVAQKALERDANLAEAHFSVATALVNSGQFGASLPYFQRAVELGRNSKNLATFWHGLGAALGFDGQLVEALRACEAGLSLETDNYVSRINRSLLLLKSGMFELGWQEYEWRRRSPVWDTLTLPHVPVWRGEDVRGKTVVLLAEQGSGDSIQFIRYAPLLSSRGARVLVACKHELKRLMRTVEGVDGVFDPGDGRIAADFQCHLMSLPLQFKTTVETIPDNVPYIRADPTDVARWADRLGPQSGLRVGLVWAGERRLDIHLDRASRRRNLPFSAYRPFFDIPSIYFFSLQKKTQITEDRDSSTSPLLTEFPADVDDFLDIVPLIENLDLVISVDTAVAHLAGAMGKPTWLLSRYDGCWRWLSGRSDTPWYPTTRIFRQPTSGDWQTPISEVKIELERFAHERGAPTSSGR